MTGVGFALAMTVGLATGTAAQERDFEWAGRLESGQGLAVRGISGDVVAHLASGSEARVEARKTGRSSDFDRVEIVMVENRDEVVFCVIYDGRGNSECDDRSDDERGERDRSVRVSVDFVVYVPEGVPFSGHTVSGDVEALDLRSDVEATTVSGDVKVSTSGVATGRTVSGDVEVAMGSLDWQRLDFDTVSGDITVEVPANVDAEIEFESLSGDFDSDFDMLVHSRKNGFVGQHLQATIGDGSRSMRFKTVSGDARLRRVGTDMR